MEEPVKTTAGQGFGIASLILGILALLIAFIPCIGIFALLPGIIAIVLSIVGLSQARNSNGTTGIIIAGLVISIIGTLIAAVWILFFSASGLLLKNLDNENGKLDVVIEEFVKKFENEYGTEIESDVKKTDSDLEKTLEELEKKDSLNTIQYGTDPDLPDSNVVKK